MTAYRAEPWKAEPWKPEAVPPAATAVPAAATAVPSGATTYLPLRNVHDAVLVERLLSDYGHALSLAAIAAAVNRCRAELTDTRAGAMPELLERLTRQRIESDAG